MRLVGYLSACIAASLLWSLEGACQSKGQDASLRGLQKVHVLMERGPLSAEHFESYKSIVSLELRKAGLRIVEDRKDFEDAKDGVVAVAFHQLDRAMSQDLSLELVVFQQVRSVRTGEALVLPTWRLVDDRRAVVPPNVSEQMLRGGIDKFLNAWLSVNGR